ncbi:MAG: N-acetylmuramoyl-L-alanine amidase [Phycisphaerales bacterium]|nr:N-acetylmuramoyl-L-alanine amidase [Phycisphaerales bacterium]
MLRYFVITALLTLALCPGCQSPDRRDSSRLPEPPLATRSPEVPPVRPTPPPPPADDGITGRGRAAWIPPTGIKKSMWRVIVVHHSDSEKSTPQSMNQWHLQRGWENGLGYHFVIGNGVNTGDGQVYVGPRWKRQIQGAHCKTGAGRFFGLPRPSGFFNDRGIGICLVGDFENSRPTAKQLAALTELIAFLSKECNIPATAVYGHGEVTRQTLCPGKNFRIADVRKRVTNATAGSH